MFPHQTPTHLTTDVRLLGVSPTALPWIGAGVLLGLWLTGPLSLLVLAALRHYGLPSDPGLPRLGLFLLGFLPCYGMAIWRPLGLDPFKYALIRARHFVAIELCVWRAYGLVLPVPEPEAPGDTEEEGVTEW